MVSDEKKDQEINGAEQAKPEQPKVEPKPEAVDSYKEQFLRVSADFQNFQRRIERDRARWIHDAQAAVLKPIILSLGDLDRAIAAAQANEVGKEKYDWLEGLLLMQKNIAKTLKELGVEEVDCTGEFNPELHDALMHVDAPGKTSGHIEQVLSKGYKFDGEVLIHAKVSVAK